jgi:hypothetical protein
MQVTPGGCPVQDVPLRQDAQSAPWGLSEQTLSLKRPHQAVADCIERTSRSVVVSRRLFARGQIVVYIRAGRLLTSPGSVSAGSL